MCTTRRTCACMDTKENFKKSIVRADAKLKYITIQKHFIFAFHVLKDKAYVFRSKNGHFS